MNGTTLQGSPESGAKGTDCLFWNIPARIQALINEAQGWFSLLPFSLRHKNNKKWMRLKANENHIGKARHSQTYGWAGCKELKFFNHLTGNVAKKKMQFETHTHTHFHTIPSSFFTVDESRWWRQDMMRTIPAFHLLYKGLWQSVIFAAMVLGNPSINSYSLSIHNTLCIGHRSQ